MNKEEIVELADETLGNVSGGMTANLKAAYACINGVYGNGTERRLNLMRAGYDPDLVQGMVNSIIAGYDKVAIDVINGAYGVGQARILNLTKAGYDANAVQTLVNHLLWN